MAGGGDRTPDLPLLNHLTPHTNVLYNTVKLARAKLPAMAAGKLIRR